MSETWTREAVTNVSRSGELSAHQQTLGRSVTNVSRSGELSAHQQTLSRSRVDLPIQTGLLVPTGEFEAVNALILDEDGDPIRGRPLWVLPRERFPVAAPVDPETHTATLWLLDGFKYDRFQLIVQSPRGNRLAWFEATEADVWAGQDETAVLHFEPVHDTGGLTVGIAQMG